jgi:hypothetical protein
MLADILAFLSSGRLVDELTCVRQQSKWLENLAESIPRFVHVAFFVSTKSHPEKLDSYVFENEWFVTGNSKPSYSPLIFNFTKSMFD